MNLERILVTGANGSLGQAVMPHLAKAEDVLATDIDTLNVCDRAQVDYVLHDFQPSLILHLAGAKSAPIGEEHPEQALWVNGVGTANIVKSAEYHGARVITASTCKACDPETVYGASKLIAERLTLNAGGSVARFYNIIESSGNVFELWEELPEDEPIPVTDCGRRFISMRQAVSLLLQVIDLPPGRYTVAPKPGLSMSLVARSLYPKREQAQIPRRRGDRRIEPLSADCEQVVDVVPGIVEIVCAHDREAVPA